MAPLPAPLVTGDAAPVVGVHVTVEGVVQGVGLRPCVWRLANELGLAGWVKGDADQGVTLVAAGPEAMVGALEMACTLGPLNALIDNVESSPARWPERPGFELRS